MRQIGTLVNAADAERFVDYLLTLQIDARVESDADQSSVWVRDEQYVDQARTLFAQFQSSPNSPEYRQAANEAKELRQEEVRRRKEIEKRTVDVRKVWEQPRLSRCPITLSLILISVAISAATEFGKGPLATEWLQMDDYTRISPQTIQIQNQLQDLLARGQIWRLVTPIFIHMSWIHILFNLYWTYQFGMLIESKRGSWQILGLAVFIAVVSNVGQYTASGPTFGGLSGVIYGFFGYLWIKSRFDPASGLRIPDNLVVFFLIWLVLCAFGLFGDIANTAHFTGLFAGVAVAGATLFLRRR